MSTPRWHQTCHGCMDSIVVIEGYSQQGSQADQFVVSRALLASCATT